MAKATASSREHSQRGRVQRRVIYPRSTSQKKQTVEPFMKVLRHDFTELSVDHGVLPALQWDRARVLKV
jgi:hypothetical protein